MMLLAVVNPLITYMNSFFCAPTGWSIYVKIALRIIVGWVERSQNLTLYFARSKTILSHSQFPAGNEVLKEF
ncbi:MAG: hypothetical protein V7K53_19110 [Nostoc sp.]|uniref:hypothetical protein n=1 Tax=Nostoc sp. TaxID=1180 RepID=UPI002FFAD7A7